MAVNQSHTESRRGALIPSGESVLKQSQDVDLSFLQQPVGSDLFSGTKRGTLFLTSYRVIFVTSHLVSDPMLSFMMPFGLMSNCTIEQPIFAPNYIKGAIQAAPDGGWEGQAIFKLSFRKGGAIEFAQLMMKAASAAARGIPLGSVNYWFGASGLYIITTPGGMMCTQQAPCPAYPVVVYGPPPPGYGAQTGEYGAPPAGYGAPPMGYGAPPVGYGAPPVGYGALPVGYGALPGGYAAPPAGYGAPPAGYGAPPGGYAAPAGYGALPGGYGAPPVTYEALSAEYGAPSAGNEAPPPAYEAPPAGNRAASHKSVAARPEASLPSTSSSLARLPPSKK
ncbi:postacrosomal sheath WW domain-binding protein [Hippopotamus amphibius kiboko]|uniref:postacrosomal sheath WW domain-binding protein n=1 Tax=Hippopotamus amphibius kiboko TaxID=575201 RepID=UPI0025997942|nr:postacrosomal sheath WW domain-binding protein [Hippopotamus amphibius kiboko]